jgi:hypothetical protein
VRGVFDGFSGDIGKRHSAFVFFMPIERTRTDKQFSAMRESDYYNSYLFHATFAATQPFPAINE